MLFIIGGVLLQLANDPLADYKVLAAILFVLTIVAGAGWKLYQSVTDRLEKAKDKDLAIDRERREWTSTEAEKSRKHFTDITRDFKEALYQMETRRDQNDETQSEALNKLAETMGRLAANMDAHDKTVNEMVVKRLERIEQNTQPRTQTNKGSSRGAG